MSFSSEQEQGYRAFQLNEAEIVAAQSWDEARNWFLESWGFQPEELFQQPVIIDLDERIHYVDDPTALLREVSFRELIDEAIDARLEFPCIIATYDWEPIN